MEIEIDLGCGHEATEGSVVFSPYTMKADAPIVNVAKDGWFSVSGDTLNGDRCICVPCADRYWPKRSRA